MQRWVFISVLFLCFLSVLTENVPTYQKNSEDAIIDKNTIKDKNEACPMIKFFGGSRDEHYDTNNTRFCKHIKKTCCKFEDFTQLNSWWVEQMPQKIEWEHYNNRTSLREKHLETIFRSVVELYNLKSSLKEKIRESQETNANKMNPSCKQAFEVFQELPMPETQSFQQDYKQAAKKCWKFTNDFQGSFLCSFCDPKSNNEFDINSSSLDIKLRGENCYSQVNKCSDLAMINSNNVFPYLMVLNALTQCDIEGNPLPPRDEETEPPANQLKPELDYMLIENCYYNGSNCIDFCEKSLKFGSLSVDLEGDPIYFYEILKKTVSFMGKRMIADQNISKEIDKKVELSKRTNYNSQIEKLFPQATDKRELSKDLNGNKVKGSVTEMISALCSCSKLDIIIEAGQYHLNSEEEINKLIGKYLERHLTQNKVPVHKGHVEIKCSMKLNKILQSFKKYHKGLLINTRKDISRRLYAVNDNYSQKFELIFNIIFLNNF